MVLPIYNYITASGSLTLLIYLPYSFLNPTSQLKLTKHRLSINISSHLCHFMHPLTKDLKELYECISTINLSL